VHNMCLVRPVLLYLSMHVLKVFYEQNRWNGMDKWRKSNVAFLSLPEKNIFCPFGGTPGAIPSNIYVIPTVEKVGIT